MVLPCAALRRAAAGRARWQPASHCGSTRHSRYPRQATCTAMQPSHLPLPVPHPPHTVQDLTCIASPTPCPSSTDASSRCLRAWCEPRHAAASRAGSRTLSCGTSRTQNCAWKRVGSPGYSRYSDPNLDPPVIRYLIPKGGGRGGTGWCKGGREARCGTEQSAAGLRAAASMDAMPTSGRGLGVPAARQRHTGTVPWVCRVPQWRQCQCPATPCPHPDWCRSRNTQ